MSEIPEPEHLIAGDESEVLIDRDHLLSTLAKVPSATAPIVFVEGESGSGATTLLSQFHAKYEKDCFSLFLRPASKFAYSADYLRQLLAEQFADYLGIESPKIVDVAQFQSLLFAVRKARARKVTFFVIDGLHQIPKGESHALVEIFSSVLPTGIEGFRFIVVGDQEVIGQHLPKVQSKSYQIADFSLQETGAMLADLSLESREVENVHKLCRGLPGRIAVVKRLLCSGSSLVSILQAGPAEYLEFINLELNVIEELSEVQRLAISTLAFSKHLVGRETILDVSKATPADLEIICTSCRFLDIPEAPHFASFQSETHRRWAEKKLSNYRDRVHDGYIELLSSKPGTADSIEFLPTYMLARNKQEDLVAALSPEHYQQLLGATKSLSALRARASMGARAAAELKLACEMFQFSLQKSIFADLTEAEDHEEEVAALVALGSVDRALDLASQASTTEARLRMLSQYAKDVQVQRGKVDDQLKEYIRELSEQVTTPSGADELERLAENISFFDPDLAISLLSKPVADDRSFNSDLAMVKLGISSTALNSAHRAAIIEKTKGKVSDEKLRNLIGFVESISNGAGTAAVIEFARSMKADRKIQFLRSVLASERSGDEHLELLEYALDELVNSSSYVPKIKDFADFAVALRFAPDGCPEIPKLVARIDSQLGLVVGLGLSSDHTRVQMRLALAESKYDFASASARMLNAYFAIAEAESIEARVECAAIMLNYARQIDRGGVLENEHGIQEVLSRELRSGLDDLLSKTADHYEMVKGALGAIARFDAHAAYGIAFSLNTRDSRDSALRLVAQNIVLKSPTPDELAALDATIAHMSSASMRAACVLDACKAVKRGSYVSDWLPTLHRTCLSLKHSEASARAALLLIEMFNVENAEEVTSVNALAGYIEECVTLISSVPCKIGIQFLLAKNLAQISRDRAWEVYEKAAVARRDSQISTEASSETMRICLSLCLRAFKGLIKYDELSDEMIRRFVRLCDAASDPKIRVGFLSDLACKAWCEKKLDLCRSLVDDYIRPILDSTEDVGSSKDLHAIAFPAVYLSRGAIAFDLIGQASVGLRDDLLESTINVILRKVSEGDPWAGELDLLQITASEAEDVVKLLEKISTDAVIYRSIISLTSAMNSKNSKTKLTRQQRARIRDELLEIADKKFPDLENIRHEGYRFVTQARCGTLGDEPLGFWLKLLARAEEVPNQSDAILVKLEVISSMPQKFASERKKALADVYPLILAIPSTYDRFWRLEAYADVAKDVDPFRARDAIQDAFRATFDVVDSSTASRCRRQALTIAEIVDPKLADHLLESMDDDPARAESKRDAERHTKIARAGKKIAATTDESNTLELGSDLLPAAAWKKLGSLIGGKSAAIAPHHLEKYVIASADWDLHDAYPVLSWYIENMGQRFMRKVDISSKLVPLTEAILLSSELALSLVSRLAGRREAPVFQAVTDDTGVVVAKGARDEALNFVRGWLRENFSEGEDVIVCDPYFGLGDLELIRMINSEVVAPNISVLTSKKAMGSTSQSDFELGWRRLSDDSPPTTTVIIVSDADNSDGACPIHDRWILAREGGIKIGTSFGGLGNKLSDVSEINQLKRDAVYHEIADFLRQKRVVGSSRLRYGVLSL